MVSQDCFQFGDVGSCISVGVDQRFETSNVSASVGDERVLSHVQSAVLRAEEALRMNMAGIEV